MSVIVTFKKKNTVDYPRNPCIIGFIKSILKRIGNRLPSDNKRKHM